MRVGEPLTLSCCGLGRGLMAGDRRTRPTSPATSDEDKGLK
jgi:hypothetical protein